MKRTPLKRNKTFKVRRRPQGSRVSRKPHKKRKERASVRSQKVPDWFSQLPWKSSDHGSNANQRRLWRLVSEYVRQRDFELYGYCAACKTPFTCWQEGQAGHFKAWSRCSGMFKYNEKNLALICAGCNRFGDGVTNANFAVEMQRRHGEDYVEWITAMNLAHKDSRLDTEEIVKYAQEIIRKKATLLQGR